METKKKKWWKNPRERKELVTVKRKEYNLRIIPPYGNRQTYSQFCSLFIYKLLGKQLDFLIKEESLMKPQSTNTTRTNLRVGEIRENRKEELKYIY